MQSKQTGALQANDTDQLGNGNDQMQQYNTCAENTTSAYSLDAPFSEEISERIGVSATTENVDGKMQHVVDYIKFQMPPAEVKGWNRVHEFVRLNWSHKMIAMANDDTADLNFAWCVRSSIRDLLPSYLCP